MKTLRDLGPGDEVAIMERGAVLRIVSVERVTPMQIIADGARRWRRSTGRDIPAGPWNNRQHVEPATDAHRRALRGDPATEGA